MRLTTACKEAQSMAATPTLSFGDVVLVPFPFTDQSGTKKRPAVVVSSQGYNTHRRDIVIMAITSQSALSPRSASTPCASTPAASSVISPRRAIACCGLRHKKPLTSPSRLRGTVPAGSSRL